MVWYLMVFISDSQNFFLRDKLSKGEKPVFKSKKEKREQDLVDTYERLKKSGKVDKYIEKKSKRNTAKDRQMLENNQLYANDLDWFL